MRTTNRDLVRRAFVLMGVVRAGEQPTGHDAADGLEHLQGVDLGLPGLIFNAPWYEKAISTAYTAIEGHRITVTPPGVVTLPTIVTGFGQARPPHDLSRVQIIDAVNDNAGLWVYSASNAAWGQVDALTLDSDSPFGPEDDAGLAALLARDLSDLYPNAIGPRTLALAEQASRTFRARFKKAWDCCCRDIFPLTDNGMPDYMPHDLADCWADI